MSSRRLLISFSGGKTSAYMTWWLLQNYRKLGFDETLVVFANTGKEREETLDFVQKCDTVFNFNVVWVEAVQGAKHREGVTARIVTHETASRNGEPFEDFIKKFGLPHQANPKCANQLKRDAIQAYCRSIGWKYRTYETAIGIRTDEMDRINWKKYKENRLFYPLATVHPMSKNDINHWFMGQEFDLGVYISKHYFVDPYNPKLEYDFRYGKPWWKNKYNYSIPNKPHRLDTETEYFINLKSYEGNCDACWKKDIKKLMTIAADNPEVFAWWKEMETKYENYIPESRKKNKKIKIPARFFWNQFSVADIFDKIKKGFTRARDVTYDLLPIQRPLFDWTDDDIDIVENQNSCKESCEPF